MLEFTDAKNARPVVFPRVTVEVALYAAFALMGLFARLLVLGDAPLSSAEARQALASWNFLNGKPDVFADSPLLFTGNAILFALFGANDTLARLLPALFGSALVLLPALVRRELGRVGALATSALFVFSPSLVFFSRNLDGAIIAVTCALAAFAFGWRYLTDGTARDLNLAAIFAALALISAREVWTIAFALALFVLVTRVAFPSAIPQRDPQSKIGNPKSAIVLFAIFFLAIATAFTLRRDGIGATFDLFGAWLAGLQPGAAFYDPLRLLVVYDPIPLFFGIVALIQFGVIEIGARARAFFNALTFWAIVAFAAYSLGADKNPARVVVLVVPLTMLAGWYIGVWLERARRETDAEFFLSQELPVFVFACVIGAFLYLVIVEFATRGSLAATMALTRAFGLERLPDAALDLQIISVLMLIALAAVAFLVVATVGWRRAPVFALALVLTGLAVWTWRQTAIVNYANALNAREYLVARAASANVRDLERDLRDISRWRAGDATTLAIVADETLNPIVAWTLRDFRNARFAARTSVTQDPQVFLLPARAPAPGSGWVRQAYTLENQRAPGGTSSFLRWWLFRDVGALESDAVALWMRQPE
ncbi:MAG: glycosyltransferase family 39 protein [Chloroflexota bacterium]